MASMQPADKHGLTPVETVVADSNDGDKMGRVTQVGAMRVLGLDVEDEDYYVNYPPDHRSKLVHKIDVRLTPVLAILYLISHLDRGNIGNANIEGLSVDLGLTGVQYNVALSILFVTYIIFEIPSNMLLKIYFDKKPSYYMGLLVTCWGIVMTMTGVVQNYAGLVVCRLLLGLFEAGFFPGAIYLCTQWYMPGELALRISYLYLTSALSSAFSGLLAAAIAEMDGAGGYEGWRWIFILEGIATVLLGVLTFKLLIDTPDQSKWLSPEEKRYLNIQAFVKEGGDFGRKTKESNRLALRQTFMDWKLYVMSLLLFVNIAAGYGVKLTMPAIIKGMGFENRNAQLMTAPPYIAGAISTVVSSKLSDRYYRRMPFIVIPWIIFIIGYAVIMSFGAHTADNVGPSYFAVFLVCIGLFPVNPAITSWTANNIAPASKRAIGLAFYVSVGNIGGVLAGFMFLQHEAPAYPTGYGISIGVLGLGVIVALLLEFAYIRINKQRAQMSAEEVKARYTEEELASMGDNSPLFKYIL
ncbi:uncharacterized protein HMPREF1541_09920 [Cyphellophora europaea CBS 101466]|uniref:Major facilitator superfamily (MFS) profile domain-containing protein n=1 Tax=Cyphellophora europaea (strain CBS 101466) TaxID=1220924 RepID=W2SAV9_CYPE1|nr:uncharacterized protein HMPREF1541_09920 [Cyphellophora europaea CBS 101466]ETN45044.1 hypothetical protein HMPREF1541_09920 [Cyphellophora europaea CBS 101466]